MQKFMSKRCITKKQKRKAKQIAWGALMYLGGILLSHLVLETYAIPIFLIAYIYMAKDILRKAFGNIKNGQIFDENFLMSIASLGALFLQEYTEAVAVVLFYEIGEWFQSYALNQSRESIAALMDIRPDYANIEKDGKLIQVDPTSVQVGDVIVVQPGERVPLDGVVVEGSSSLDTSALTGESKPRSVRVQDVIMSGCINQSGVLKVRVTSMFTDSTVAKILDLVENASNKKSTSEQFITKFARYYTPIVVYCAIALTIIPSLIWSDWANWFYRSLTFLVISCPCALVISVPLSFFGGIGNASKNGILVKGSHDIENVSRIDTVVFDKTGTLTEGKFKVSHISSQILSDESMLYYAAMAEAYSNHPIALSIKEAYGKEVDTTKICDAMEVSGKGVQITLDGKKIWVGKHREEVQKQDSKTIVYVYIDDVYQGLIELSDTIKQNAKEDLQKIRDCGVKRLVMLTGDHESVAKSVAQQVGMDAYYADLLPQDKVSLLDTLMQENEHVAFVGDGINDAPVLMHANVGIAMGGLGSDAAIEASDVVLMEDKLGHIAKAIQISKKTIRIAYENIVFAIGVKILVLILGALGIANMWMAVFADVGVAMIAILNAMRALND